MTKEYAIKIECNKAGVVFHHYLTEEELKDAKIYIGRVEMTTIDKEKEENFIKAGFYNIIDLYKNFKFEEGDVKLL